MKMPTVHAAKNCPVHGKDERQAATRQNAGCLKCHAAYCREWRKRKKAGK